MCLATVFSRGVSAEELGIISIFRLGFSWGHIHTLVGLKSEITSETLEVLGIPLEAAPVVARALGPMGESTAIGVEDIMKSFVSNGFYVLTCKSDHNDSGRPNTSSNT